jgi:hypothetical protein
MKVGDLVKLGRRDRAQRREPSFIGIVAGFDEDDDPVVQWFLKGDEIFIESEYRSQVQIVSEA